MDVLDQHGDMNGGYLVMDNAPIHTSSLIQDEIVLRGYRCVYLPPHSSELNPIEQLCSVAKARVRRHLLMDKETLSARIAEAYNSVPVNQILNFIRHPYDHFDDCLNKVQF